MLHFEYVGIILIILTMIVLFKRNKIGKKTLKLAGLGFVLSFTWEMFHYITDIVQPTEECSKIGYSLSHAFYDMIVFLALSGIAALIFGTKALFSLDKRVLLFYLVVGLTQEWIVEELFGKGKVWTYEVRWWNPKVGRHTIVPFLEWIIFPFLYWYLSSVKM